MLKRNLSRKIWTNYLICSKYIWRLVTWELSKKNLPPKPTERERERENSLSFGSLFNTWWNEFMLSCCFEFPYLWRHKKCSFYWQGKRETYFKCYQKVEWIIFHCYQTWFYSCNRFSPVYIFIRTFDIPGFIVLQNLWLVGCLLQACNSEDISSLLGTFYRQYWSVPEVSPLLQCSLQFIKVQQMFWKSWDQVLQGSRFQFDRTCYSKGN